LAGAGPARAAGPLRRRARICVTVGAAARAPVGGEVAWELALPMPVVRADRNPFGLEHSLPLGGGHTAPCGEGRGRTSTAPISQSRLRRGVRGPEWPRRLRCGPFRRAHARRAGPPAGHLQRGEAGGQSRTPPRGGPSACCACTQRWLRVHPETREGERLQVDFEGSRRLGGQPQLNPLWRHSAQRPRCPTSWANAAAVAAGSGGRRDAVEAARLCLGAAEPPPSPHSASGFAATVLCLTRDHVTTGWRACCGSWWPTAGAREESGVDQERKQRQPSGRKSQRRRAARGGGLATLRGPRCK